MIKKTKVKLISIIIMLLILLSLVLIKSFNFSIFNKNIIIGMLLFTVILAIYNFTLNNHREEIDNAFASNRKFIFNLVDYLSVFVSAILFLQIIFTFFLFPAIVNQTSMNPTLYEGDRLIIFNGNDKLDRFDIVVFSVNPQTQVAINEDEAGDLWVKRVIGLPGEYIEYKNGLLYVNGEQIYEPHLYDENDQFQQGSYINNKGVRFSYNSYTNDFTINSVLNLTDFEGNVIPEDYYLLLGDNRMGSKDSRYIGLVHRSLIIGEGKYIMRSFTNWEKIGD